ncbi:hypothetical protein CBR_g88532 [Chara braunii]|uniref:Uncharacterized protein n=1 Tax=Chara braunii TaxID=69332 RepID=A0A388KBB4_CHABU|nr:hypothetical protein CBR_g88532 [Chara braunii]|eukprot:GBG67243.1 hypothetical protein CBR_g88532 [Chara braunii]
MEEPSTSSKKAIEAKEEEEQPAAEGSTGDEGTTTLSTGDCRSFYRNLTLAKGIGSSPISDKPEDEGSSAHAAASADVTGQKDGVGDTGRVRGEEETAWESHVHDFWFDRGDFERRSGIDPDDIDDASTRVTIADSEFVDDELGVQLDDMDELEIARYDTFSEGDHEEVGEEDDPTEGEEHGVGVTRDRERPLAFAVC